MATLPTDDIESLVQNQQRSTSYMAAIPVAGGGGGVSANLKPTDGMAQRHKNSVSAELSPNKTKSGYVNQPNQKQQPQQKSIVKKTPTTTEEVSALGSIQQNNNDQPTIIKRKRNNKRLIIIIGASIGLFLLIILLIIIIVGFVTNWEFS